MNKQKYTITCKKCGNIRDISEQINNELDFKEKEMLDDEIKFLNWILNKNMNIWGKKEIEERLQELKDRLKQKLKGASI